MSKNVLVLVGSPRIKGNTDLLADAFIEGLQNKSVTKINVCKKNIKPCVSCHYCAKNDGICVLKDDMNEIYDLLEKSDIIVFASPLYFYNFSSQLKAVIDRFHAKTSVNKIKILKSVLLTVGADDLKAFEPIISTYKAIINYLKWEDIGILAVDGVEEKGAILKTDALEKAKFLANKVNKLKPHKQI